jgi:hypothetical protein
MTHRAITTVFALSMCVVSSFLLHCVGNNSLAGGVETTNGLVVVSSGLTVHGIAPAGSMVSIFADFYNPTQNNRKAFSDSASVDSEKTFSFKQIGESGMYNVIAINPVTHQGAMIPSLYMWPGGHDSIVVPFDTLGEIGGVVTYVKNADTIALGSRDVYCEGSNFFARSDSAGFYKMSNVPLGKYRVALVLSISSMVGETGFEMKQVAELNDKNPAVILNFVVK